MEQEEDIKRTGSNQYTLLLRIKDVAILEITQVAGYY